MVCETYAIEVKTITKHKLPFCDGLDGEGLEGADESEDEGGGVSECRGQPVDPDPVCLWARDAALTFQQGCSYDTTGKSR